MLNDFGTFLDSLRKSRNMSREEFVEDILSLRQYQRYVNGESSLNNDKLFKLIDRTGMNFLTVHKLYVIKNSQQLPLLNSVYKEILSQNYILAKEILAELKSHEIHDEYSKSFYNLCKLILHRRTNTMPSNLIVDKLKNLIGYPECMNNEIISFVEFIAYLDISDNSNDKNDTLKIVNFLYKKINEGNITSDSLQILYLPSTYAHIASKLGFFEEYEKSLIIADKGIDFCLKYDSLNSLAHLFFYKALTLKKLDRNEEALIIAKKAFYTLFVEDKDYKTKSFTKSFEKEFNMKVSNL
jgi:transcriptional regulator with XRE-family HTH domain